MQLPGITERDGRALRKGQDGYRDRSTTGTMARLGIVLLTMMATTISLSSLASATMATTSTGGAPVEVGLPVVANLGAVTSVFGSNGQTVPQSTQEEQAQTAIIDYIDAHGGVLGHKIQPEFAVINAGTATSASVDQQMCTTFTQDHHVFAVMMQPNHTNTEITCLNAKHIVSLDGAGFLAADAADLAKYPYYATAGSLNLTGVAKLEANGLYKAGFYGTPKTAKSDKIGLIAYNTPSFMNSINQVLKPDLAKHGLKISDQAYVSPIGSVADAINAQVPITSAALRFKSEGINHVIFMETEGALVYNWLSAETAESYFPHLGVTTNDDVGSKSSPTCGVCKSLDQSWTGAVGVGWDPSDDLTVAPINATAALCNKIVEKAGVSPSEAPSEWGVCDQLLVFAKAVNAGGKLTPAAVMQGLTKVANFTPAELAGPVGYTNGTKDGVGYAKMMAWEKSCQCFQYTSKLIPVSTLENG